MAARFITLSLVTLLLCVTPASSCLRSKPPTQTDTGHCVMYGLCGNNPRGQSVPCSYTGPAKPLTTPSDRQLLAELCPDLAQEKSTCCDSSQLKRLRDDLAVPRQLLSRCPACFHNFRNIFCYLTCSPTQSKYLTVTKTFKSTKLQVAALNYTVSTTFSNGMYKSCKDVYYPSFDVKALGLLCGHSPSQCTPKKWLDFLGNEGNGQTPYQINFNLTNDPALHPMNATVIPCSSPADNKSSCSCTDCKSGSCATTTTTASPFYPLYPCKNVSTLGSRNRNFPYEYLPIDVVIQRKGNLPWITHHLPPPSTKSVLFNPVFNKTFLYRVLNLTTDISNLVVTSGKYRATLSDVCMHSNMTKAHECVTPSVLQFFQNSYANINRTALDATGFFAKEDYLDHLLYCFQHPDSPREPLPLKMSCVSEYGGVLQPPEIFCGFYGNQYQNSTGLIVTYFIKDPRTFILPAVWKSGLSDFIKVWLTVNKDISVEIYEPFWAQ